MKIIILGSTGSIGTQALEILRKSMIVFDEIEIVGLACGKNYTLLEEQIEQFHPRYVATSYKPFSLVNKYPNTTFFYGRDALRKLLRIEECDTVLNAIVGSAGFIPSILAIQHHKKLLLANKESLVMGGEIIKRKLKSYKGTLYPIDSEHSALWELLEQYNREDIDYCTITASGGAFRNIPIDKLDSVQTYEALMHPNWKMGMKITIDSATMMNKGFEVIEAHYLFDIPLDKIKTIINPSSKVHATITLKDGREIYAIDKVSMENPIRRALFYPYISKLEEPIKDGDLTFIDIDPKRYPCLGLAYVAMEKGGLYPTILNAANEAAVNLYLDSKIKFTDIYKVNKEMLDTIVCNDALTAMNVMKWDKKVKDIVNKKYGGQK